jgi:cyclopropane fatty-acyl-phospholipid synthase-like methyltransferase
MIYKNKFYKKYSSTHTSNLYDTPSLEGIENQFYIWKKYFEKFLPKDKKAKILDLGCGKGGFVHWFNSKEFESVLGLDVSEEQINQSKKLGIENVKKVDVIEFLKSNDQKYDLIFARDFLEHFPKEQVMEILDLIHKNLNDDGKLIAQTLNAENILWGRLRHGDFTHDTAFTKQSIEQALMISGFDKIKVYPQRPVIHGLKSLIRYTLWRFFELLMKFYLLVETGSSKGIFTQNIIVEAKK